MSHRCGRSEFPGCISCSASCWSSRRSFSTTSIRPSESCAAPPLGLHLVSCFWPCFRDTNAYLKHFYRFSPPYNLGSSALLWHARVCGGWAADWAGRVYIGEGLINLSTIQYMQVGPLRFFDLLSGCLTLFSGVAFVCVSRRPSATSRSTRLTGTFSAGACDAALPRFLSLP